MYQQFRPAQPPSARVTMVRGFVIFVRIRPACVTQIGLNQLVPRRAR